MKKDNVISADNCQVSGIDEETLFVSKYPASESTLDDASELYGSVKLKSMSSALSLLMLVILILLAIALPDQILILGVGALTVALFSAFATNWARIQRKAVDASSLKKAVGSKCVVTLTDSHVRVVADGEEIDVFSLTDLKRVRANEIGCLADFGKKRIAYFQQKGMSKTKFGNLIRSLDVILMANKMSKKAKRPKDMPSVDINTEEHHTGNGNAESACSD